MQATATVSQRHRSGLGVIIPLAALVLFATIGAALLTINATGEQNRLQLEHEKGLIRYLLANIEDMVVKSTKDYANWDDAFVALARGPDHEWIDNNLIGAYSNLGFEYGGIVDLQGNTVALFLEGTRLQQTVHEMLTGGLHLLFAKAREQVGESTEPVPGMVADEQGPVLLAASVVAPQNKHLREEHGEPAYIFFFGQRLRPDLIRAAGERLNLKDLRLLPSNAEKLPNDAVFVIRAVDDSELAWLVWTPASPGDRLARTSLPVLAAIALVTTLLVLLALARMKRMTAELEASERRFFDLATVSSDWIFETDAHGRLNYLSERSQQVFGREATSLLGKSITELLETTDEALRSAGSLAERLARGLAFRDLLCRPLAPPGARQVLRLSARPVRDRNGRLLGWRGTVADVTSEHEARDRVHFLAFHDPLTGLVNRASFRALLEDHLGALARGDRRFALFLLDLDRFKDVNDALGHAAGDELLRLAAARLRAALRDSDVLARLGGDEFAILVPDLVDPDQMLALARRLVACLHEPFDLGGQRVCTGTSIGIAVAPDHGSSPDDLLRHADIALYRAKAMGRGHPRLFEPSMAEQHAERQRLEADLRTALERGELEVHYQPKFDPHTGALTSCEALLRWRHRERGLVPPSRFIPLAEETGLIHAIGSWVLERACSQAATWGGLPIAVNLSPVQFRDEGLAERIRRVLETTGLPPDRLELEITETALVEEPERAVATLAKLKALGVRIAMDDFGTGHSSLGHLQRLPFDKLKIDRSFVDRLENGPRDRAIVAAIVDLARALGMTTCAEGVETDGQLDALRQTGCQEVQGFLLARPLPAEEFAARFLAPPPPGRPALAPPANSRVDRSASVRTNLAPHPALCAQSSP